MLNKKGSQDRTLWYTQRGFRPLTEQTIHPYPRLPAIEIATHEQQGGTSETIRMKIFCKFNIICHCSVLS